jgi:hypothetical protein
MILSKNDSNYLKGIAMILMMLHHLFAFPERIWNGENIICRKFLVSINHIG